MPALILSNQPLVIAIGFAIAIFLAFFSTLVLYLNKVHQDKNIISSLNTRLNTTKAELTHLTQKYVQSGIVDTLNTLLEETAIGAITLDEKGLVYKINAFALALGGYISATELLVKPVESLFISDNSEIKFDPAHISNYFQNQKTLTLSGDFIRNDNQHLPVSGWLIPFTQNGVNQILFLFQDALAEKSTKIQIDTTIASLTSRIRNLSEQVAVNQTFTDCITNSPFGVILINQNAKINFANPYALKLLESEMDLILGKNFPEIIPLVDKITQPALGIIQQALLGHDGEIPKWSFLKTRKSTIPVRGMAKTIQTNNGETLVLFVFLNATDDYYEETEEKAFFSGAAHDLRTPLTAIRGFIELVVGSLDKMSPEQIKELLTQANSSVLHLVNLVNDLLNVSRIDMGRIQMTKESFNIVALTRQSIESQSGLLKSKKLFIDYEINDIDIPKVYGDKTKTEEIIINLISNAVKYTQQGGLTITHSVSDSNVITHFKDSGMGISPENQSLLFKKFQQVGESRNQAATKSTGLGLYIAKKFAQLMGGDLVLESSVPGNGSQFAFALPIAPRNT
jgi:signal transduction histidine kinase